MNEVIALLEKEIYLIDYRIKFGLVTQGGIKDLNVKKHYLDIAIKKLSKVENL
jgi:phenolic acid decarboxylase